MSYTTPKRPVNRVFIHCSDSDHDHHNNIDVIRKWHVEERGFADVGYHFFIQRDGTVQIGRNLEVIPAAQKGHNWGTIAICLHGKDYFSDKQKRALTKLCWSINGKHKGITFHGHTEVDPGKTCPNFGYKNTLGLNARGEISPLIIQKPLTWWQKLLRFLTNRKGEPYG